MDTSVDLPPHQPAPRGFVEREITLKGSDQCRTATCKHDVSPYRSAIFYDLQVTRTQPSSFTISRNSKTPFFPRIHRAARRAPRANPSRFLAAWRMVMVSALESKPISCVPGGAPARFALKLSDRSKPACFI